MDLRPGLAYSGGVSHFTRELLIVTIFFKRFSKFSWFLFQMELLPVRFFICLKETNWDSRLIFSQSMVFMTLLCASGLFELQTSVNFLHDANHNLPDIIIFRCIDIDIDENRP